MTERLSAWTVVYTEYRQEKHKIVLARSAEDALKVFTEMRQHAAVRLNKSYLATNFTLLRAEKVDQHG